MSEYRLKKQRMFDYLGGVCKECGDADELQIDHVDPTTKAFDVSSQWGLKWEVLVLELDKCQLLCKLHHLEKSIRNKELKGGQNRLGDCPHGTVWGYAGRWKCRCEDCRKAKRDYEKARTAADLAAPTTLSV
jgi:hypothetical protein